MAKAPSPKPKRVKGQDPITGSAISNPKPRTLDPQPPSRNLSLENLNFLSEVICLRSEVPSLLSEVPCLMSKVLCLMSEVPSLLSEVPCLMSGVPCRITLLLKGACKYCRPRTSIKEHVYKYYRARARIVEWSAPGWVMGASALSLPPSMRSRSIERSSPNLKTLSPNPKSP